MITGTQTHRCQPAEPVQPTRGIEALSEISEAGERFLIKFCVAGLFALAVIGLHGLLGATERAEQQIAQANTSTTHVIQCASDQHPAVDGKE